MPIPTPNSGESHDDFMDRCHKALADEFEDRDQRHAVCEQAWRDRNKSADDQHGRGPMDLAHKAIASGVEVKDPERGIVQAVVARVGVKDLEGDVFLPGSFGERDVRLSAYNHRSWPQRGGLPPVGRGTIRERGEEVIADLRFFMKTRDGREHFEQVKEMADLQEWSFGWLPGTEKLATLTEEQETAGIRRAFEGVPVVEVSPVLMGASIDTHTTAVKCEACAAKDGPKDEENEEIGPTEAELKDQVAAEVGRYELLKREFSAP